MRKGEGRHRESVSQHVCVSGCILHVRVYTYLQAFLCLLVTDKCVYQRHWRQHVLSVEQMIQRASSASIPALRARRPVSIFSSTYSIWRPSLLSNCQFMQDAENMAGLHSQSRVQFLQVVPFSTLPTGAPPSLSSIQHTPNRCATLSILHSAHTQQVRHPLYPPFSTLPTGAPPSLSSIQHTPNRCSTLSILHSAQSQQVRHPLYPPFSTLPTGAPPSLSSIQHTPNRCATLSILHSAQSQQVRHPLYPPFSTLPTGAPPSLSSIQHTPNRCATLSILHSAHSQQVRHPLYPPFSTLPTGAPPSLSSRNWN